MVSDKDFVETRFVYDEPLNDDLELGRCDRTGTLNKNLLREWTPYREAEFFCCGPRPFMEQMYASLQELGVDESRIHFEFFGPRQQLQLPVA